MCAVIAELVTPIMSDSSFRFMPCAWPNNCTIFSLVGLASALHRFISCSLSFTSSIGFTDTPIIQNQVYYIM